MKENSLLNIARKKQPSNITVMRCLLNIKLSIFETNLVPKTFFSNLAKPTLSGFKTLDGYKSSINQLPVPIDFIL